MTLPTLLRLSAALLSLSLVSAAPAELVDRSLENGVALRLLPLGDSITYGHKSTDGNGYRQDLLNLINGNKATYIGSHKAGNMTNNENEGWPGYEIDQISVKADLSLPKRPNVVLLMAGINDIRNEYNVSTAPTRLGNLLDKIYKTCPDAVTVLAQLTPVSNSGDEAQVKTFNAAIPDLVASRTKAGHKIVIVDMSNTKDGLTTKDLADGLHPNDGGYKKMANVWFDGLTSAAKQNLITAPVTPNSS